MHWEKKASYVEQDANKVECRASSETPVSEFRLCCVVLLGWTGLTLLVHILRNAVAALPLFSRKRKGATKTRRERVHDDVRVRYALLLVL